MEFLNVNICDDPSNGGSNIDCTSSIQATTRRSNFGPMFCGITPPVVLYKHGKTNQ